MKRMIAFSPRFAPAMMLLALIGVIAIATASLNPAAQARQTPPPPNAAVVNGGGAPASYYAYIACESEDEVALVKLVAPASGDAKLEVVERIRVGIYDAEIEGPHGLGVSPDGKYWFVSIAHGRPFGMLYKYTTDGNELVDEVELGMFPATMQISPVTGLMHIVNFNLHGKHEPSTVSIVDPEGMEEVTRVTTGVMPHGSRFSPDGLKHYSLSMMTDELFEIDALELAISRTLNVHSGEAVMHHMDGADDATYQHGDDHQGDGHGAATVDSGDQTQQHQHAAQGHAQHAAQDATQDHAQHGDAMHHHAVAKPTWVQMHPTKPLAYVACNGSNEVVELDLEEWKITRRFPTGKGPYNVEVTPDGTKFVVTYKSDAATGIWDIDSGEELARIENSRKVPHGIAITPDSRFAIVTVEGIGGEPGGVDAIDLQSLKRVDVANIGKQAGGIVFWKMED